MNPSFGGRLMVVNNVGLGFDTPPTINISIGHVCGDRVPETVMNNVTIKPWQASDVVLFITERDEDDYWTIHFNCEIDGTSKTYDARQIKATYDFEDDGGVMIINLHPGSPGSYTMGAEMVFPRSSNVKVHLTSN